MARKPRNNLSAYKVNGQRIRPKKNRGGKNGQLTGAAEVQRISAMVDRYDAEIRASEYAPDEGWHQFADHTGLLGDVLRAKGLI